MPAKTLTSLLPPLSNDEQVAVTKLHSLAGKLLDDIVTDRPFRAPHHTAGRATLIGGETYPRPGEISLAHLGVLFLDEIPEYPHSILESLRQPIEDKKIAVSRANSHVEYPADFMLVGTVNPCPCGYYGDATRECSCAATQIMAYQKRLSGPMLDRIDLIVSVSRVPNDTLLTTNLQTNIQQLAAKSIITIATEKQLDRYKSSTKHNNNLTNRDIKTKLALSPEVRQLLGTATDKLNLSAAAILKSFA